ncbi:rab family, other [Fonticula alba]|uniref:Rab family, other n=1 Tax=Fonticula alba TaxID=691883 RepID=A0A058ZEB7_FONAL|nr:rab family, other [Fonticula alba]KCV72750.1 rab family, other [Fonticula alba]|eukprot:XP_009492451.1 rab family, other [Fonticula alba]
MSSGFVAHDYQFKVILCGDSDVGKSNILGRFSRDEFNPSSKATLAIEFSTKVILHEGKRLTVHIWDTAGQERFTALTRNYFRGAVGALIVYDITSVESFNSVPRWLSLLRSHAHPATVVCLVGNKIDLEANRKVPTQSGSDFAKAHGLLFHETSACTGVGINLTFHQLIVSIYNAVSQPAGGAQTADVEQEQAPLPAQAANNTTVNITEQADEDSDACGC